MDASATATATATRPAARAVRVGMLLAGAVAALCALWLAREVLLLALLATVVAVLFSFPVGWLERLVPRGVAVVLVLLLLGGAGAAIGLAAAPTLSRQVSQVSESAPRALRSARDWLERLEPATGGRSTPPGAAARQAPQVLQAVTAQALPAVVDVVRVVTEALLVVVLAAFLVHQPDTYRRGLRRLVPPAHEAAFDELWRRLGASLRHWVGGVLVSMSIMGTLAAAGLLLVGIHDWLLLGVLTFLGTFVPYLGAITSAIPGLLAALAQDAHHFVLALAVYVGVHVTEGYVVQPLVMRRAVEMRPALLLLGQGIFGAVFGILGVVVATPLLVCLQVAAGYLWVERRLGKQPA